MRCIGSIIVLVGVYERVDEVGDSCEMVLSQKLEINLLETGFFPYGTG